jgi:hypothetical protein
MAFKFAEEAEFLRWIDAKYRGRLVPNPSREDARTTPRVDARKAYFHPEWRKKEEEAFLRDKEERQREEAGAMSAAREHFSKAFQELRQGQAKLPQAKYRSSLLGKAPPAQEIQSIIRDLERRLLHLLAKSQ